MSSAAHNSSLRVQWLQISAGLILAIVPGLLWWVSALSLPRSYAIWTRSKEGIVYILVVLSVAGIWAALRYGLGWLWHVRAIGALHRQRQRMLATVGSSLLAAGLAGIMVMGSCLALSSMAIGITFPPINAAQPDLIKARAEPLLGPLSDDIRRGVVEWCAGFGIDVFHWTLAEEGVSAATGNRYEVKGGYLYEEYGWPWRCVRSPVPIEPRSEQLTAETLTLQLTSVRLLPIGFGANMLVLIAISSIPSLLWRAAGMIRRLHRAGRGCCTECGYILKDLPRCPECGTQASKVR